MHDLLLLELWPPDMHCGMSQPERARFSWLTATLFYPRNCSFFLKKEVFNIFVFSFQGFTELLPIDLIKIFDENELEVCVINTFYIKYSVSLLRKRHFCIL